jgi:hypothetical protein
MIETISHQGSIVAIIVYKDHHVNGIEFITPNEFSLQLGYMSRPVGYRVMPHIHHPVRRETIGTQEVLFIKEGVIRIDFYSFEQVYLESRQLSAGDFVLLVGAGHGITVLEPAIIVEVKNGPYLSEADKGRFEGIKY